MPRKAKVELPVGPLADLMNWWQAQSVQGLIIGGLAVALLGRPRVTRDIDVMVLVAEERWPAFLNSGATFGFVPRHTDSLEFAREARVLLLHHQPTGIDVDVAFGCLPFEEEAIARAIVTEIAGIGA